MTFNMILSAALLFSSFAFQAAWAQQITRVDFHFGFFDMGFTPSLADITEEDVKAIMCQTQSILTASIQDVLPVGMKVKATDIDWSYDGTQEKPARVDFTIQVTDQAGQEADVENAYAILMGAMDDMDINAFILNLPGFFEDTNSFGWGIQQMDTPVRSKLDQVQCEGDDPLVVVTNAPTSSSVVDPQASEAAAPVVSPAPPTPEKEAEPTEPAETVNDSASTSTEPADITNDGNVSETAPLAASAAAPSCFVSTASFAIFASLVMAVFL